MLCPPSLHAGDLISIVPTARAIDEEELLVGMALATSWGLRVKLGGGVGRKHFQQAGTDAERTADLQAAIMDPEVKAIWCARGGYGTVHLMEGIDLSPLRSHPKWIVGFSDVTVLHSALHNIGLCSIHAQMPFHIAEKSKGCKETLRMALFGEDLSIERAAGATKSEGSSIDRHGTCEGTLVGGNLSLLYALRGTPYDLNTTGKILFLEDLDELLYHVDRMVMNLKLGRLFDDISGLVVGAMNDMHDKNPADPFGQSAEAIIAKAVEGKGYPVCFGFPSGHIADNRALVFGQKAKLSVTPEGVTLSFAHDRSV